MLKEDVPERATMQSVVVDKMKLIETLRTNLATHREQFEEALSGYRVRCIELLEEHIERIRRGKVERVMVSLPMPEDHTDDYERAISTLEWTLLDTVELSIAEFDQYVRDNWRWKGEFTATSTMYATGSAGR
jgi:hypothetical protein